MPDDSQDLSHLSPEAVLGITPLKREELLKAAAEAPDTQLILPEIASSPILVPRTTLSELPLPPLAPTIANLVAPLPVLAPAPPVMPSLALPSIPIPSIALPSIPLPTRKESKHIATPDIEIIKPKRVPAALNKSKVPVFIGVLTSAFVLAALGAVAFILVERGLRLPILYTLASHLQPTGLAERDAAIVAIGKQSGYKLTEGTSQSLTGTPKLSASLNSGWVGLPNGKTYVDEHFRSSGTEIPLLFRSGVPATILFPLAKPASNQSPEGVAFRASPLSATLQPIPLLTLLRAVTKETGYTAATADGLHVARYTYALNSAQLEASMPTGSTISNSTLLVEYGWGSDLPRSSTVFGSLVINGTTSDYSADAVYSGWGDSLPTTFTALDTQQADPVTLENLKAELGVNAISVPLVTAKPTAFIPLVPANISVPSLSPVVTASPPPPASTPTTEGTSRDAERKADLALLRTAIAGYKTTTREYPISNGLEQVQASSYLFKALVPTYLTAMPVDPLSTVYWYEYQSDGKTFILRSVAEDPTDPLAKLGKAYHYFIVNN